MRLSIRIKFFIVLLAFSIGPILISRGITNRAANKMAEEVSEKSRRELLEIVSAELEHNVVSLLSILEARGQALTLGARMLAQRAGFFLNGQLPESEAKPYFSIDFSDPETTPPDVGFADGYEKRTMMGGFRPIKVSFDHPTVHLPRSVNEDYTTQVQRLQGMLPMFKELYGELNTASYWFHIGLKSGVYMTYPGYGNFPMMYDHRDQRWYKRVRQASGIAWTSPVVAPASRIPVATVGYPIWDDSGEFIGTAAIDIPISALLYETDLKSRWSDDILSFMVIRTPSEKDSADDNLLILAQQTYDGRGRRHWMSGIKQEWLSSDDPNGFKNFMQEMSENTSGVIRLSYKGNDSVWSFASNSQFSLILIAPESAVSQIPNEMSNSLSGLFAKMRSISASISCTMLIITGLIAWFGSRAITRPLLTMADKVRRLANGDFSAHLDMNTGDERDAFIKSFNEMGPKLKKLMLINKDLELAQEVQRLLLPRNEPQLEGYDISGGIAYCDQTGGDYYDFIKIKCESGSALGVVLGDVSGHGVPSALVMATARGQLHSLAKIAMAPEARISAINNFLSNDLDGTGRFLTLFYLQLKEGTGTVKWVRAGHDPAIRYTPETDEFGELGGDGLTLGVLADFKFQGYETTIKPGEILTLATDGVWEARNLTGEMFGKKRILAIIRDNAHKSAEIIRKAIMDGVSAYQGNGQEDDIAVVVIKKA